MSVEEHKAAVRRFFEELWNKGDLAVADELVAPNFEMYVPTGHMSGAEGLKGWVTAVRGGFPDVHFTLHEFIAEGERVMVRWEASGTNSGPFAGMPATDKPMTFGGVGIFLFEDGKIVEERAFEDTLSLLQQLGVIPAPG